MSLARKGYRWTHSVGKNAPDVTDELTGAIWQDAPAWTLQQGRKMVFAPDVNAFHNQGAYSVMRAAGASSNAAYFGGIGTMWSCSIGIAATGTEVTASIGGNLLLQNGTADNDRIAMCFNGGGGGSSVMGSYLPFQLGANTVVRCGIRAKISDATESDFLFGLGAVSVDPITTPMSGVYFRKPDGDTQPDIVLRQGGAETATAMLMDDGVTPITIQNNTWFEAGFVFYGITKCEAYFNGHRTVTTTMTNKPTVAMCPNLCIQNGTNASKSASINKFVITQDIV